jgi:phenylalanyl-tRNA synthetase alpha chain
LADNPVTANLDALREEALSALGALDTSDAGAVERWRVEYLGRKGRLTAALRSVAALPPDQRRDFGAAANTLKELLERNLDEKRAGAAAGRAATPVTLDISLPGRRLRQGRLHPSTQIIREICRAFNDMGFQTVEGPEVEWERYNFDLLNIPRDHPARDLWNTIWVEQDEGRRTADGQRILLRTHTSPMQARVMEKTPPPVRVVVPGKCYRVEATDATHEWQFHQVEGLAVDEGITFADLKGTLFEFARRIFGAERKVRFRCDYFPFVEPGVDMSIDCFACSGTGRRPERHPEPVEGRRPEVLEGCRICKSSGWIEIMGAGMVHPKVLAAAGYDTEKYTGFAFGMGPERIAMLRYGIEDIRHFFANDLRFLSQF